MRFICAVCALGVAAAVSGAAQDRQPQADKTDKKTDKETIGQPAKPAAAPAQPASSGGGVMVFIDPVTKQIVQPTPAQIGTLAPATPATAAPVTQFAVPTGGFGVKLDESHMSNMVVTKGPDGTLNTDCVDGTKAAASRVKAAGSDKPAAPTDTKKTSQK